MGSMIGRAIIGVPRSKRWRRSIFPGEGSRFENCAVSQREFDAAMIFRSNSFEEPMAATDGAIETIFEPSPMANSRIGACQILEADARNLARRVARQILPVRSEQLVRSTLVATGQFLPDRLSRSE